MSVACGASRLLPFPSWVLQAEDDTLVLSRSHRQVPESHCLHREGARGPASLLCPGRGRAVAAHALPSAHGSQTPPESRGACRQSNPRDPAASLPGFTELEPLGLAPEVCIFTVFPRNREASVPEAARAWGRQQSGVASSATWS